VSGQATGKKKQSGQADRDLRKVDRGLGQVQELLGKARFNYGQIRASSHEHGQQKNRVREGSIRSGQLQAGSCRSENKSGKSRQVTTNLGCIFRFSGQQEELGKKALICILM